MDNDSNFRIDGFFYAAAELRFKPSRFSTEKFSLFILSLWFESRTSIYFIPNTANIVSIILGLSLLKEKYLSVNSKVHSEFTSIFSDLNPKLVS